MKYNVKEVEFEFCLDYAKLTFDERSELLKHLEMFDEHIDQLHPLVESVQDKLLGID